MVNTINLKIEWRPTDSADRICAIVGVENVETLLAAIRQCIEREYRQRVLAIDCVALGECVVVGLQLESGRYALKLLGADSERCSAAAELWREMSRGALPAPPLSITAEGRSYCTCMSQMGILYPWQSGTWLRPGHAPHRRAIAQMLRRIHEMCSQLPIAERFPIVRLPLTNRLQALEKLLVQTSTTQKGREVAACLQQVAANRGHWLACLEQAAPPALLTHEELRRDNCIFEDDVISGILDWDGCRRQYRIDSVAQTATWYSLDPKHEGGLPPSSSDVRQFYAEYCSVDVPFGELEARCFPALVAFHAARATACWPAMFQRDVQRWLELGRALIEW